LLVLLLLDGDDVTSRRRPLFLEDECGCLPNLERGPKRGGKACARRGVRAKTMLAAMMIGRCCCRMAEKKGDVVSWKECLFGWC